MYTCNSNIRKIRNSCFKYANKHYKPTVLTIQSSINICLGSGELTFAYVCAGWGWAGCRLPPVWSRGIRLLGLFLGYTSTAT